MVRYCQVLIYQILEKLKHLPFYPRRELPKESEELQLSQPNVHSRHWSWLPLLMLKLLNHPNQKEVCWRRYCKVATLKSKIDAAAIPAAIKADLRAKTSQLEVHIHVIKSFVSLDSSE
ncbi:hypothetical protein BHE74_00017854 [Ensete ventricosum]|nr:hypothetical protein GW17_00004869 [Ensete ventricosum]RWW74226.1 hypothetical protein BHE74_00017854 [Ensete ventricosum]RZR93061.1 hypothetical protein BHM03_00021478 [Ensete ventricosum]